MKNPDAPNSKTNPSTRFSGVGSLGDHRTLSTKSGGPKIMNTIGAQTPTAVHGSYPRSVISFLMFFNKVMKIMFSDTAAKRSGQAPWFTETCFFYTITYFPVVLSPNVPLSMFTVGFPVLVLLNVLRYKIVRLSNDRLSRASSGEAEG